MAYFLKKTNNKKGTYLQIYESYYDPERKGGAHRSYKPVGYVHELQAGGIDDPIAFFSDEVQKLNQEYKKNKQAEKKRQITDESPEKFLGYFPLKNLNDSLGCRKYIDLMQTATNFRFNIFDMMTSLVYARLVHPCSKSKTYDEVIPKLFENYDFSLDQLYSGLEYIGSEYDISSGIIAGSTAALNPHTSTAQMATCVTATDATPKILPIISSKGLTLDTNTSSTRLPFSSITEVITIEP